jgi:AbrB family looped-hinge helix DNA binding protein
MQAVIDDQGRVEIPRALRDRLHLTPGVLVDLEPVENGLNLTPVANSADRLSGAPKLMREGSLLVLCGSAPLNLEDVNRAIDVGRSERLGHITGEDIESQ